MQVNKHTSFRRQFWFPVTLNLGLWRTKDASCGKRAHPREVFSLCQVEMSRSSNNEREALYLQRSEIVSDFCWGKRSATAPIYYESHGIIWFFCLFYPSFEEDEIAFVSTLETLPLFLELLDLINLQLFATFLGKYLTDLILYVAKMDLSIRMSWRRQTKNESVKRSQNWNIFVNLFEIQMSLKKT